MNRVEHVVARAGKTKRPAIWMSNSDSIPHRMTSRRFVFVLRYPATNRTDQTESVSRENAIEMIVGVIPWRGRARDYRCYER